MSLTRGYSPTSASTNSLVPLRSKFARRFYEPIVLLVSLNVASGVLQTARAPDLSFDLAQSPERAFHCFVNKLGQLCDSELHGKSVTAFVVLQFTDGLIQYRFASNQRKEEELIRTKSFVEYVLQVLGRADAHKSREMASHILREALSFNKTRVESYVKLLEENIPLCINSCDGEETEESESILEQLEQLRELLSFFGERNLETNAFSKHCESLINAIDRLYRSNVNELIRDRTNEGRMNESKCWCELRHGAGRLLSYLQAVKCLFSTRKRWPELFEKFEVNYIISSLPAQCPIPNRNKVEQMSMTDITGRMTSDPTVLESCRTWAQELKRFQVDEVIRIEARDLRPYVHAEVLVLESLVRDGGTHYSRFFGGYRYIGCSKPTCRLCHYYFSFHESGMEVRPTHRNIYPSWRMPNVYSNQGPEAAKKREELMNNILDRVRDDTFRALIEKIPEKKLHDSNTEPTYPVDSISARDLDHIDQLATAFKAFDIGTESDVEEEGSAKL